MLKSVSKSIPGDVSLIYEQQDAFSEARHSSSESGNPSLAESLAQINRIVKSDHLYSSETLGRLLEYLAQHTLNSPDDHLKEYRIATEILNRGSDFDPRYDASVRVQIGRLRTKLAEYYSSTGAHDPILIDIPKGRYTLLFERRSVDDTLKAQETPHLSDLADPATPIEPAAVTKLLVRAREFIVPAVVAGALLLAGGLLAGFLYHRATPPAQASQSATGVPTSALSVFWNPLLRRSEEPFVIFSNAAFVGDAESGMRYFDPVRDSQDHVTYHYTGVGEVMDVVELNRLFYRFGRQFRIKPGGLFTLDDARNYSLFFVGSPTENTTLREIPSSREFVFRRMPDGPNRWNQVIVDLHPKPGETGVYTPTPRSRPLDLEYAIISLSRGLDPTRWTLILAGTSTIGTQAAVDYVCDTDSLDQLLRSLNISSESDLPPFEALLRVKVANDVPLESHLVVVRRSGR